MKDDRALDLVGVANSLIKLPLTSVVFSKTKILKFIIFKKPLYIICGKLTVFSILFCAIIGFSTDAC